MYTQNIVSHSRSRCYSHSYIINSMPGPGCSHHRPRSYAMRQSTVIYHAENQSKRQSR